LIATTWPELGEKNAVNLVLLLLFGGSKEAAIEHGIIEPPLRRSDLPNQLDEIVPVFVIAGAAAFRGKIKL